MVIKIKKLLQNHTIIFIYTLVLLVLFYGVFETSKFKYFPELLIFSFSLYFFYFLFLMLQKKFESKLKINALNFIVNNKKLNGLAIFISIFSILFILYHFFTLNGVPTLKALNENKIDEVALIRYSISENTGVLEGYLSSFLLKGILPFLIFYFLITKKRVLYYIILFISCFYAFGLMQKSFIITLLLPALIYVIFNKKYLFTIKYIILIIGIIFSLSIIANPDEEDIQSNTNIDEQEINQLDSNNVLIENTSEESKFYKLYRIYIGLKNRVIVVPGEIVSEWFEAVPSEKPFLNGLGYRFVAKLRGKEHVNYSDDLYPIIRPQYAERGLTGTVNTASFMYDYVNFGKIGLIISGFILSILFLFIESIFKSEFVFKLSLNLFHILILSSTALTTTLFSGGWFILIFLFFVFKKNLVLKND